MTFIIVYVIIALFAAILILNLYFRIKVLKHYKYLVKNRVQFRTRDIFNSEFMESEVCSKYPKHADQIRKFVRYIRFSVRMAISLVVLIAIFGAILMYTS